uniref:Endoplasmic reticulum transmembrane protein n=1 Tax=Strongyloides papillosus TaxID=174720 RepID=A0A0N5CFC9_STREA
MIVCSNVTLNFVCVNSLNRIYGEENSFGVTGLTITVVVLIVRAVHVAVEFLYKNKSRENKLLKIATLTVTKSEPYDIKIKETQQLSVGERRGSEETAKLTNS